MEVVTQFLTGEKGTAMEDSTAKGLKEARKKRERIAKVKSTIVSIIGIWLMISIVICAVLMWSTS